MSGVRLPHHRVRVTSRMWAEPLVWNEFLDYINGVSLSKKDLHLNAEVQVHLDVVDSVSFGVYFLRNWCLRKGWTRDLTFEFYPILVFIWLWDKCGFLMWQYCSGPSH